MSSVRFPTFPPPQFICSLPRISQFNPQMWIRKQSSPVEARAEPGCTLPYCTALTFTTPGHTKGRSKLLLFHASKTWGNTSPRETAFAAFLVSAITYRSPLLSWSSTSQLTVLTPWGFSQCRIASHQHAQKINPIYLKQHKPAEILVNLPTPLQARLHMRFAWLLNSTLQLMPCTRQQLPFSQWRLETVGTSEPQMTH